MVAVLLVVVMPDAKLLLLVVMAEERVFTEMANELLLLETTPFVVLMDEAMELLPLV